MNNVLEMLENSASKYPDKIIFEDESSKISYREFVKSAKLAATAISKEFDYGCAVPIYMDKCVETLIWMFGAIYAGCFYTIVDTAHPLTRVESILSTLKINKMLTTKDYVAKLDKMGYTNGCVLCEDIKVDKIDDELISSVRNRHNVLMPLYCNFTSGSTGIPKGVVVGHASVIDFISYFTSIFNINSNDIIGNQAPFDFDVSVKDIYSTICTGATMVVIPKRKFSFPVELMDYLVEKEITTLIWAVSAVCIISTLKGFTYKVPDKINKVIFSGEVMPIKQLKIWKEYLPNALYVNVYGPTEITCNCTYHIVEDIDDSKGIPIGKPFPNEKVFLLSEEDNLVNKPFEDGEICVAGQCLALGYYNNEEQTKKAFVQNPLNTVYNEMIYRTGDLAYYGEDGLLYYKGRRDFQIKHMGHRIELGEIESAMEQIKEVERACCIFNKDINNIVAFYKGSVDVKSVKRYLRSKLPAFMVPIKMYNIEEFPLTKNGKIDRNELTKLGE